MAFTRIPSAATLGAMNLLQYKSKVSISNGVSAQTLTAPVAKVLLGGGLINDLLGRWDAYDSGSGSADSIRWNGEHSIDVYVHLSMAVKHSSTDGKPVASRHLCYLSGTLVSEGHLYVGTPSSNNTVNSSSCMFPLTFTSGDYLYYNSNYLAQGGSTSTTARIEANLCNIVIEER